MLLYHTCTYQKSLSCCRSTRQLQLNSQNWGTIYLTNQCSKRRKSWFGIKNIIWVFCLCNETELMSYGSLHIYMGKCIYFRHKANIWDVASLHVLEWFPSSPLVWFILGATEYGRLKHWLPICSTSWPQPCWNLHTVFWRQKKHWHMRCGFAILAIYRVSLHKWKKKICLGKASIWFWCHAYWGRSAEFHGVTYCEIRMNEISTWDAIRNNHFNF